MTAGAAVSGSAGVAASSYGGGLARVGGSVIFSAWKLEQKEI